MIHFVGAGPGAPDLITVRGQRLLERADVIIYAGSLVNPELLRAAGPECRIYDSARMTLEEVIGVMERAEKDGLMTVRLHTGDPSVYGAVREQMEEGRTKVPERESVESFAAHGATMVLFLSSGMIGELAQRLLEGGYPPQTPAAIVYKATWPEEEQMICTVETLERTAAENGINRTALIIVGEAVRYNCLKTRADLDRREVPEGNNPQNPGERAGGFEKSRLYDAGFTTGYRTAKIRRTGND